MQINIKAYFGKNIVNTQPVSLAKVVFGSPANESVENNSLHLIEIEQILEFCININLSSIEFYNLEN